MFIMSGVLAFDILDRLTGAWSVMDSPWMQDFANPMIRNTPVIWFAINLIFWALVAFVLVRLLALFIFTSNGNTIIRVRVMQKFIPVRSAQSRLQIRTPLRSWRARSSHTSTALCAGR